MADYWKSQERKYCEFCKCWISNNKPSVQFHENGKKHKENVTKKIADVRQQSAKDQKEKNQVDKEMKKMEQAAMHAYLKDIESNPDYTSQVIKEEAAKKRAAKEAEQREREKIVAAEKEESSCKIEPDTSKSARHEDVSKKWFEARSPEGHLYYWNVDTNESKWEPPDEAYVSLKEQMKEAEEKKKLEEKQKEEEKERKSQEELRKRKLEIAKANERTKHLPSYGPAPRPAKPDPYGGWQTVQNEEEHVDLQLPEQQIVELNVPSLVTEQPKFVFKEKTVSTLSSLVQESVKQESGVSAFKKRKINAKGNARQRLDDD